MQSKADQPETTDEAEAERLSRAEAFVRDCFAILGEKHGHDVVRATAHKVIAALPVRPRVLPWPGGKQA